MSADNNQQDNHTNAPLFDEEFKKKVKAKFDSFIAIFKREVNRTTLIGKNMLQTSKTNACLQETYRKMGIYLFEEMEAGRMSCPDCQSGKIPELNKLVKDYKAELLRLEADLKVIKAQGREQTTTSK